LVGTAFGEYFGSGDCSMIEPQLRSEPQRELALRLRPMGF